MKFILYLLLCNFLIIHECSKIKTQKQKKTLFHSKLKQNNSLEIKKLEDYFRGQQKEKIITLQKNEHIYEDLNSIIYSVLNKNKHIVFLIYSIKDEELSALRSFISPDIKLTFNSNKIYSTEGIHKNQDVNANQSIEIGWSFQKIFNSIQSAKIKKNEGNLIIFEKLYSLLNKNVAEAVIALKTIHDLILHLDYIYMYIYNLIDYIKQEQEQAKITGDKSKAIELEIQLFEIHKLYNDIFDKIRINLEIFKNKTGRYPRGLKIKLNISKLKLKIFKKRYIYLYSKAAHADFKMKSLSNSRLENFDFGLTGKFSNSSQNEIWGDDKNFSASFYLSYNINLNTFFDSKKNKNRSLYLEYLKNKEDIILNANKFSQSTKTGLKNHKINEDHLYLYKSLCQEKLEAYNNGGYLKELADSVYRYLKHLNNINYDYLNNIVNVLILLIDFKTVKLNISKIYKKNNTII